MMNKIQKFKALLKNGHPFMAFLIIAVFTLAACSKDDDKLDINPIDLTGTEWLNQGMWGNDYVRLKFTTSSVAELRVQNGNMPLEFLGHWAYILDDDEITLIHADGVVYGTIEDNVMRIWGYDPGLQMIVSNVFTRQ